MRELFFKQMKEVFKNDYDKFLISLNKPPIKTLYLNQLLTSNLDDISIKLNKTNIHPNMYYYDFDKIGKTYEYQLGLIYPQELSAGIAPLILNPKENSLVLDMCSAPGGKAIQLYNMLKNDGYLIANEYNYQRCLIELSNFERLGFSNFCLTNNDTSQIADKLENMIDYCLVDAPCSGEGMVRKIPEIIDDYNEKNIEICTIRQKKILEDAYKCLKKGGYLVYSTCTFNYFENEMMVKNFLALHDDLELINIDFNHEVREIYKNRVLRFSFLNDTEGQFIALIRKKGELSNAKKTYLKTVKNKYVEKFIDDNFKLKEYYLYCRNDYYYISLKPLIDIPLNVVRQGICMGKLKKNNFIPEHHLYRAYELKGSYKYVYELSDQEYIIFISGNEIKADKDLKGYHLVTYKGYQLGFVKAVEGRLKNKYPKGLRIML